MKKFKITKHDVKTVALMSGGFLAIALAAYKDGAHNLIKVFQKLDLNVVTKDGDILDLEELKKQF